VRRGPRELDGPLLFLAGDVASYLTGTPSSSMAADHEVTATTRFDRLQSWVGRVRPVGRAQRPPG
jgi:hypothetical protein